MSLELPEPWEKLFVQGCENEIEMPMRLVCRGGRALLLLPNQGKLAAKGLDLYAAQTFGARLAKACLRLALKAGMAPGLQKVTLRLAREDPFGAYLRRTAGARDDETAPMAMLAGNPRTKGQRCTFLLFDPENKPVAVVKAGAGPEAMRLIEHEESFLRNVPAGTPGVPVLRSVHRSDRVRALATDFFGGASPRGSQSSTVGELLSSWINTARQARVEDLPVWQRLQSGCPSSLPDAVKAMASTEVCPAIFHGDFVPWNIKDDDGRWTLVDWERAELDGIPGWDWLHFVVQPAILVEHASVATVIERLEKLFESEHFVRYAQRARIAGSGKKLSLAYLHYCISVLRQSEGLQQVEELAAVAARKWFLTGQSSSSS